MRPNRSFGVLSTAGAFALSIAAIAAYSGVLANGFVNFDDDLYVTKNTHVQEGLALSAIRWAFTSGYAVNWHPVTWLSHMLDYAMFGMNPAGHHAVSLLLHAVNSILLFLLLSRTTGAPGRSLFVAAVFAVHPAHVESVAWVAERKDVLSTAFGLAAMIAYSEYTRHQRRRDYLLTAGCYALGLLAKPMIVTLPLLLLLLDYWPLARIERPFRGSQAARLCLEKLPLLVMALASSAITVAVQQAGGAIGSIDRFPLSQRVANACTAYVVYLGKIVWPTRLAVFYPYPENGIPFVMAAGCLALLALITASAWRLRFASPAFLAGWLWFLLTLSPVIGLLQFGEQAYADRYLYLAMAGPVLALTWTASSVLPRGKRVFVGLAVIVPLALIPVTRAQVRHWHDSESLFQHALAVTRDNYVAYYNLGNVRGRDGQNAQAIRFYEEALRCRPNYVPALNNLGLQWVAAGRLDEALACYRKALAVEPGNGTALTNTGIALARLGRNEEALDAFREAERKPGFRTAEVKNNQAVALAAMGRLDDAIACLEAAVALQPGYAAAHRNLGHLLSEAGRHEAAIAQYETLIEDPATAGEGHFNLGIEYVALNDSNRALAHFLEALAADPNNVDAHVWAGDLLAARGSRDEARAHYRAALAIAPDDERAQQGLRGVNEVPH